MKIEKRIAIFIGKYDNHLIENTLIISLLELFRILFITMLDSSTVQRVIFTIFYNRGLGKNAFAFERLYEYLKGDDERLTFRFFHIDDNNIRENFLNYIFNNVLFFHTGLLEYDQSVSAIIDRKKNHLKKFEKVNHFIVRMARDSNNNNPSLISDREKRKEILSLIDRNTEFLKLCLIDENRTKINYPVTLF